MDAFGIPFIGFPVQKRRRPKAGEWGHKPVPVQPDAKKVQYRILVPNVRSWAVGIVQPLSEIVATKDLQKTVINTSETPAEVKISPVVGFGEQVMTYDRFRAEYPVLKSVFNIATELYDRTNPTGTGRDLPSGPVFDELVELVLSYFDRGLKIVPPMDARDVGVWYWRSKILNILETAIRNSVQNGSQSIPVLGDPEWLDTTSMRHFQWTGITYEGIKTHTNLVACHNDLELRFARFLDRAPDIERYVKNENIGFSLTYYESSRPRQYYPDFVVVQKDGSNQPVFWLAETKGEIRPNTMVKAEAAELWCRKISGGNYGRWRYLLVNEKDFDRALNAGAKTFVELSKRLLATVSSQVLIKS
jgi:type III restriction enzyme